MVEYSVPETPVSLDNSHTSSGSLVMRRVGRLLIAFCLEAKFHVAGPVSDDTLKSDEFMEAMEAKDDDITSGGGCTVLSDEITCDW